MDFYAETWTPPPPFFFPRSEHYFFFPFCAFPVKNSPLLSTPSELDCPVSKKTLNVRAHNSEAPASVPARSVPAARSAEKIFRMRMTFT